MLRVGAWSEDIQLSNQLAVMCFENNFKITFIDQIEQGPGDFDYVVLDIDLDMNLAMGICEKYSKSNCKIFAVTAMPKKSIILEAKKMGCLMVLTKSNFAANLSDIISKSKV